jgi:hypothetical protein
MPIFPSPALNLALTAVCPGQVKPGWGKLKSACVYKVYAQAPLAPEALRKVVHVEWCMETLLGKAQDGVLTADQACSSPGAKLISFSLFLS